MADWYIKARDNSTLLVKDAGIEADFERLSILKKFNDVGTWALQLRCESSHWSTFAPVAGVNPNVGLLVHVDNNDGNGPQLVLSGPMLDYDEKADADGNQIAIITGASDEYYLSKRRALQVPHYPYIFGLSAKGFTVEGTLSGGSGTLEVGWYNFGTPGNLVNYFPFWDTSGTSAQNLGAGVPANGTYNGGFTLNQPSLIDAPNSCAKLNGSTGWISTPTTSLPTGNNSFTWGVWGMITANPGGTVYALSFGTNAAKQDIVLGITSGGLPTFGGSSLATVTGAVAVPLNTPFFLAITWDGTTLTGYQYSTTQQGAFGSSTPGALSITYGTAQFGAFLAGASNFWKDYLAHGFAYAGVFSASTLALMYAVGLSRETYLTYDVSSQTTASTVLYQYVQRNAASTASPVTLYGVAAPASTFTNWQRTETARAVPGLTCAADPAVGSIVQGAARQDILLDLLAALALQGGDIGFKLEQSGSNIVFTAYQPSDLTTSAIFSRDLYGAKGNILDYELKISNPSATHIIAGGANTSLGPTASLADRLFAENEDATGIANYGRLEDFLDYRQGSTNTTLQQAITGQLNADAKVVNINATLLDLPGTLYFKGPAGKGYDLGNKVRVIIRGQNYDYLIRQIQIDLQPGKPAMITPAIGTPIRAEVINEYDVLNQRLTALRAGTDTLRTNY